VAGRPRDLQAPPITIAWKNFYSRYGSFKKLLVAVIIVLKNKNTRFINLIAIHNETDRYWIIFSIYMEH